MVGQDVQHLMFKLILDGKLSLAPFVGDPAEVLDIGTGTGVWAMDFAREHPGSTVIGSDLSLVQKGTPPPNCSFVREDAEEPWVHDTLFDYIHLRLVFCMHAPFHRLNPFVGACSPPKSLPRRLKRRKTSQALDDSAALDVVTANIHTLIACFVRPKDVISKIYNQLKPGGWVEYQDLSMDEYPAVAPDSDEATKKRMESCAFEEYGKAVIKGLRNAEGFGRDPLVASKYKTWLKEAGFVDVVERVDLVPMGPFLSDPRQKELGYLVHENVQGIIKATLKALCSSGLSQEEAVALQQRARADIDDPTFRGYVKM